MDKRDVLRVLSLCRGKAKGIDMSELLFRLGMSDTETNKRKARKLIEDLRREGKGICAMPEHGYYMARNDKELRGGCKFLRSRSLNSLELEAAMLKVSLPELLGQMTMEL